MMPIRVDRAAPPLIAPPGACDTHVHIFEPERLAASARTPKPPVAPLADYFAVRESLGLSRSVLVQPPYFLFDNSAVLEATARLGASARSVVVI
jgi:D-galactarolactone isomerase